MSRFKRIKNTSTKKSSVSIDEKISALNKELGKTGMLSEITNSTAGVYSISRHIPAQDTVTSPVPDGNGLVDGTWTQPVGSAFGGGAAGTFPTTFPKFWSNAGYRTPVSGIVNTDNLHGDGANLGVAKMPNNGEPFETEVPQAVRNAGAVGGFMKYNAGINAGWRTGYMTGGTRDSGGGTFTAYDGQTFGIRYPINHLGVNVNPTSHPHLFRAVQYWHPFSIFNPDIDARWPLGDVGPKYQGVVTEIDGVKYALFTAYKWIGDGANTYTAQVSRPATTLLIQRRGIGEINYAGPITNYGLFGLSKQGFNYIDNRSRRRGGAPRMIGGPIYRKAGSGRGGKITSISRQLVPYGRGGKVSSRGVGNVLRGKGVGFSPSAGKVAQKVANQLPPKPTRAEIRKTTVDEFRKNGDNYAANKFYTEDRISELESKPNLTSSQQSELEQLKVNAVHMNQASPPPEKVIAQAQEAKEEIYSGNSSVKPDTTIESTFEAGAFTEESSNGMAEAISNIWKSYKSGEMGEKILSVLPEKGLITGKTSFEKIDFMMDGVDKAVTALNDVLDKVVPEATQKQVDTAINDFIDNFVDNFIEPNIGDKSVASDLIQEYDKHINSEDKSPVNLTTKFSKDDINAIKGLVTDEVKGLKADYLATDDPKEKARLKEEIQKKLDNGIWNLSTKSKAASLGNTFGPGGTTADVDKFIEENKLTFNDNYAFRHDPGIATNQFVSSIARLLGVSNDTVPMDSNLINTIAVPLMAKLMLRPPDDGTNRSWTENIEAAPSMPFFAEIDLNSDENPGYEPDPEKQGVSGALKTIGKGIKGLFDKAKDFFSKDKAAKANADKYPPPKQSSIFTNEDGTPMKYYTRSIFTGKDGKTYKSVLYLPYQGDNDDGSPRFGSLWSPASYTFNVPLFDTPMDEPLGDYFPPDGLPDIPFTEPEPEPDNRKDYEKNRDRQRRIRQRNSYEPKGDVLSEEAKLGHFEPEALNVDLEKLRKGIMPEYPEKPPAEMIDGYHQDSKIKPKEQPKDAYLKLNPEDLIRNHRLKKKEADEMMKTIDRINAHIEAHPEDLIHAQMRYPVDDPRLAELNWKMDQMLEAGEDYMDTNFKENQTLYKRAIDRTKKNIKLTDPEYVQQNYDELRGTTKPKKSINKRNVSRFFKKPTKKKSSMEEIDDKIKQLDKDLLL